MKTIKENPKISDKILFQLETTNINGDLITPYKIDKVVIYFLSRDFVSGNLMQQDKVIGNKSYISYFNKADTIKVFGDAINPAWFSTDLDNSSLINTATGKFDLLWQPDFAREGDYIICWSWVPQVGDDTTANYSSFYLMGDTQQTTSIPTHLTQPDKYSTLLERYTPDFLKLKLCSDDLTPDLINKLNLSISDAFTVLEDFFNQIPDLIDSNAVHEQLILFLANTLGVSLRSADITLWRRQIKQAVPLFKKKGTLKGLQEALSQSGIAFKGIKKLWQIVSPYTWQESFVYSGVNSWVLSKLAVFPDEVTPTFNNFEVYIKQIGGEYVQADILDLFFEDNEGKTTITWVPDNLLEGDKIRIIYAYNSIVDQSNEDYIRTLPLADQRDDDEVTYPPKNWNVRLIEEDDVMFNVLVPNRHPFTDPVIYGKIRTEFPYSEKAWNMDSYNGSTRDSLNHCDLDKYFLDKCSSCISSKISVDIEIENLSSSRIDEAEEIIKDYIPFHAQIHTINYSGSLSDFIVPPLESIECLIKYKGSENIVMGQGELIRSNSRNIKRDMLASMSVVDSANGNGYNNEIVLYSINTDFKIGIGDNNLLEILSGPNVGKYKVYPKDKHSVIINQSSPDSINEPIDTSGFLYRISNEIYTGNTVNINQDNITKFSDNSESLIYYGVSVGWKISISSPLLYAGDYIITSISPTDSLTISGWNFTSVSGLTYRIKNNFDVFVGDESSDGFIEVQNRAFVTTEIDLSNLVKHGDYALIMGEQYLLNDLSSNGFYIKDYSLGNAGVVDLAVYRRLINDKVGYIQYSGITLITNVNYESTLGITNGFNGTGFVLEDSKLKENYLVLINSNYYKILEIDGTTIKISGSPIDFGLSGDSINFSIIYIENQNISVKGQDFYLIDRRNNDVVRYETSYPLSMPLLTAVRQGGGILSMVGQTENITCTVEYKE